MYSHAEFVFNIAKRATVIRIPLRQFVKSWKSDCVRLPDEKNTLNSQSAFCTHSVVCNLHFVPSLHFVSGLHSAFCSPLQSAFCNQQVSVAPIQFVFVYIQLFAQHTQSTTKYQCVSLFDIFVLFCVNNLSFCQNVDITYNVSIHSPTQKENTCMHSLRACVSVFPNGISTTY